MGFWQLSRKRRRAGETPPRHRENQQRESAIVSVIVLLLRSLLEQAPNRWQERVSPASTKGHAAELLAFPKSAETEKSGASTDRGAHSRGHGYGLPLPRCTRYTGGDHIERIRLDARVTLPPRLAHTMVTLPMEAGGSTRDRTTGHDEALQEVPSSIFVSASSRGARRGCSEN